MNTVTTWLNNIPIQDPIQRRMAALLQVILLGLMGVVILATAVLLLLPSLSVQEKTETLISDLIGFLVVLLPFVLLRRGYFRGSVLIIIVVLFTTPMLAITLVLDLPNNGGVLFQFTLAILLSGLLASRRTLILVFALSATLVLFSAFRMQSSEASLVNLNIQIAINFILFNGLIALFIDRFGITLRTVLTDTLVRERELQGEIEHRKQAEEALRVSERHQASLIRLSRELEQTQTFSRVLEAALKEIKEGMGYQSVWAFLLDQDGETLKLITIQGELSDMISRDFPTLRVKGDRYLEEIIAANGPVVVEDARTDPRTNKEIVAQLQNRTIINVPLFLADRKIGALGTGSFGEEGVRIPNEDQLKYLSGMASHVAVTFDRIQLLSERIKAEAELRESEERYRFVSELTNDYAYKDRVESDGQIVPEWITESFMRITGYTVEDTRAPEFWQRLIHPEDAPILLQHLQKILSGQADTVEMRVTTKSGELRWLRDFANPIWDGSQARVVSLYGAVQDITDQKQANEQIATQANYLAKVTDAIIASDENYRIVYWNSAAESLYGWRAEEVLGKPGIQILQTEFPNSDAEEMRQSIRKINSWLGEVTQVKKDGTRFSSEVSSTVLHDENGRLKGFVSINRDLTERKNTEEKIRQLNEELEQRVVERTAQLQSANKELEAFSYSVSHDLRAPLRSIDGFTRILLEDYESTLDAEGKRLFNIVRSEAERMGQLIDDLLRFSRLSRTQMTFVALDMNILAEKIFRELTTPESRERIEFHLDTLPASSGDPSLIRQVWVNLLSNAIKFTAQKKRAVIEVGYEQIKTENIYYVRDNGAGFDMEYAKNLFGVFQRLHGEKEFEGTGVGLAIVQRVVMRHGGRVWGEGAVDKGATFHFALPRKRKPALLLKGSTDE